MKSLNNQVIKLSSHYTYMLIQIGINRLQKVNQGEYNILSYSNNKLENYIKYNNIEYNL